MKRLICLLVGCKPGARYRYHGMIHPSVGAPAHGVWVYVCSRCGGDI